jgi:hypothetical protein
MIQLARFCKVKMINTPLTTKTCATGYTRLARTHQRVATIGHIYQQTGKVRIWKVHVEEETIDWACGLLKLHIFLEAFSFQEIFTGCVSMLQTISLSGSQCVKSDHFVYLLKEWSLVCFKSAVYSDVPFYCKSQKFSTLVNALHLPLPTARSWWS